MCAGAIAVCASSVQVADGPAWTPMLGTMMKTEKAGYGGLCGMCVERATGNILINLSDRGFYRSKDGAKTFQ
jgi:hypothetical protein